MLIFAAMKNRLITILATMVILFCGFQANGQTKDPAVTVYGNGTTVINTSTLCADVEGFMGPTPVEIRIKKDTIIDITPLANQETPAYFREAVKVLKKWIGLTPAKGLEIEVDGVSGVTFSSEALIENVRTGLDKYATKSKGR